MREGAVGAVPSWFARSSGGVNKGVRAPDVRKIQSYAGDFEVGAFPSMMDQAGHQESGRTSTHSRGSNRISGRLTSESQVSARPTGASQGRRSVDRLSGGKQSMPV